MRWFLWTMPHVEEPAKSVAKYLRLIGKPLPNGGALFVGRAFTTSASDAKAPVLTLPAAATTQVIPFDCKGEEAVQEGVSFGC